MTVAITQFIDRVRPEARTAPTFTLSDYVLEAAIEFCARSRYWRADLTALNAVADQAAYTASPPSTESVIQDIISVRHNTIILEPASQEMLDSQYLDWRTETGSQADFWFATARDNITLVPYPSAAGTANIEIRAALKPSRTATTLPQSLYDNYKAEIASGALAWLLVMPGVPWASPDRAAYHERKFEDGIRHANYTAARGFNRTPIRTRRPPF